MALRLGEEFPNFKLKTTAGEYQLHDWLEDKSVAFFYSK
jgi:peroxiredoxin